MTKEPVNVQQITGTPARVRNLFQNRYSLDFYQREYSWGNTQVRELVDDLTTRFQDEFDPSHERRRVASYRPYFLGPIMTTQRDATHYLVDGQQRVTTLGLLIMYIHRSLEGDKSYDSSLAPLIYSSQYGKRSYQLDVDEREACLNAILAGESFDIDKEPESVRNVWRQFETIRDYFPSEISNKEVLPFFSDWLLERVILIHVVAPDQDMALEIFETMNDRGLRLNNIDMLKSQLLSKIKDENIIRELNERWRQRVTELADIERNADAEFVKGWLRGHYAETQRERKAKSAPGDFDIIGTAFHRWVRDNSEKTGLITPQSHQEFVEEFFDLSDRYKDLLNASRKLTPGLESVYHNAQAGFTLQLFVILAAVKPDDDDDTFRKKSALVAKALDIFLVRRMVNYRNSGYSTVVYSIFNLAKLVRRKQLEDVLSVLTRWLGGEEERLDRMEHFGLTQRNRSHVRYVLARITSWLDDQLGDQGTFVKYMDRSRKHPYEVEHVLADNFERYTHDFGSEEEFRRRRNHVGGLLLLPKDFNASYGAISYEKKVAHYGQRNSLARSLFAGTYEHNPTFVGVRNEWRLDFRSYESFGKSAIAERSKLYRELAEIVWDPRQLEARE